MSLLKGNNNSLGLSFGRQWENTKQYVLPYQATIGSSVSISGEVLTCTSIDGESSKASRFINVKAGEIVTFQVLARLTSGTQAAISIDYPTAGDLQTLTTITSPEWEWYEASFVVPLTADEDTNCVLQAGVFGSMDGTVEFMLPRATKGNSQTGSSQVLAMGQIFFNGANSGLAEINQGFCNHGVYSVIYAQAPKELHITIDKTKINDPEGAVDTTANVRIPVRPLFFGSVAYDNGGADMTVQFSDYDNTTGVVRARFYRAGVLIDMYVDSVATGNVYFNFKAEVN